MHIQINFPFITSTFYLFVYFFGFTAYSSQWQLVSTKELNVDSSPHNSGFKKLGNEKLGISFNHLLNVEKVALNRNYVLGSGVGILDYNNDGKNDILFLSSTGKNHLYQNLGSWRFHRVSISESLELSQNMSLSICGGDVNADGFKDIIISTLDEGPKLYLNRFGERFELQEAAGFQVIPGATTGLFCDIDNDGDLDFYQCYYRYFSIKDQPQLLENFSRDRDGLWIVPQKLDNRFVSTRNMSGQPMLLEKGLMDILYINDGHGTFTKTPLDDIFIPRLKSGSHFPITDWSLSGGFGDFNNDGFRDLYICSDFLSPDRIWHNTGKGQFSEIVWPQISKTSYSSMDVSIGDLNNDGFEDLFVVDMLPPSRERQLIDRGNFGSNVWMHWASGLTDQVMRNTLQRNRGDGSFAEIALASGVHASNWSWASHFLDVDLDGLLDILVCNGTAFNVQDADVQDILDQDRVVNFKPQIVGNIAWQNLGGFRFKDNSDTWSFNSKSYSQSMALGDLDGDGDKDIVINVLGGKPEIYENLSTAPRIEINFKLPDEPGTQDGIKIISAQGSLKQYRTVQLSKGFLSHSSDTVVVAGLNHHQNSELTISSSDLTLSTTITNLVSNHSYTFAKKNSKIERDQKIQSNANGVYFSKSILNGFPQLTNGHSHDQSITGNLFEDVDSSHFQKPDQIAAFRTKNNHGLISLNPSSGFRFCSLRTSELLTEHVLNQLTWPSPPTGLTTVSKADGMDIAVTGTIRSNDKSISWVQIISLGIDRTIRNKQHFQWLQQIPGRMAFDKSGQVLVIASQSKTIKNPAQGGGVLFRKIGNKWVFLTGASNAINADHPITGAAWIHDRKKESFYLILSRFLSSIEIYELTKDDKLTNQSNKFPSVSELNGMWTCLAVSPEIKKGLHILVVGNWGINNIYANQNDLIWINGFSGRNQFFSTAGINLDKPKTLLDRSTMAEFMPMIIKWFPTRRDYTRASLTDIQNLWDQNLRFVTRPIHRLKTIGYTVNVEDGLLHFEEVELPPEIHEAPLKALSWAKSNNDEVYAVFGQNISAEITNDEPLNSGAGGLMTYNREKNTLQFIEAQKSGIRLFDNINEIHHSHSDNQDHFYVARENFPVAVFKRNHSQF